jgi:Zn-dependent protease
LLPLDVLLPSIVVLVLSLSFHEAAHAWTADRLGDPTARLLGRLTLNPLAHIDWIGTVLFPLIAMISGLPLIGWAKPVPVNAHNLRSPRQGFAIVALAGPVSNLILAVGAAGVLMVWPGARSGASVGSIPVAFLTMTVLLNVLLAIFNLIPVPPLDGGNVLAGVVPEPVALMIDRLRPYGFLVLYALIFSGVLRSVVLPIEDVIARWLLL